MRPRTTRPLAHTLVAGAVVAAAALPLAVASASATEAEATKTEDGRRGPTNEDLPPGLVTGTAADRVPGEVIVRFRSGVSRSAKGLARAEAGAARSRGLGLRGLELVKVRGGVPDAIEALEMRPEVVYAEPNYVYRTSAQPDDPSFAQLWGLHNTGQPVDGVTGSRDADVDAPEAWDRETGEPATTVAVIDTGVDLDHPDLAANIWANRGEVAGNGQDDDDNGFVDDVHGWDFVTGDNDPDDLNGHGSHVAGTVGAVGDNSTGVAGVAWDVSVMPVRALDAGGGGTSANVIAAIDYAVAQGADVVNASMETSERSQAMVDAIASAKQTLFVVAAGNSGRNTSTNPTYPCNVGLANVVCVAASDSRDRLASFSNFGTRHVDLAAPGVDILSTVPSRSVLTAEPFGSTWLDRWSTSGTRTWGRELGGASDSPGRKYAANADTRLARRQAVDLTGLQGCTLGYWLALDTEAYYDELAIDASNGSERWRRIETLSGYSDGWVWLEHSLSRFDGGPVYLRFRLMSDGDTQYDGAYLDDVTVSCLDGGGDYAFSDGTSMASPHVAGAAALLVSSRPDASVASLRAALLTGVDKKASLATTTVTGGRLNVSTSLAAIQPRVGFAAASTTVQENVGVAKVSVRRTGDLSAPATVEVSTSPGTATADTDYVTTSGPVSFAAGQSTATFDVPIIQDAAVEGPETVVLSLTPVSGAAAGTNPTTTLTIAASDQQPDGSISTAKSSGYVGNNLYNTTGERQTKATKARRTQVRTFFVRVGNDGNVTNTITVKGSAAKAGSTVTYLSGTTNVTRAMRSTAGWRVKLTRGGHRVVTVRVAVTRKARIGAVLPATVRATWSGDGTRTDVVKATVKVVR